MSAPKIFTIAAGAPFAETLARGLIERTGALALADAVIYLPTRRAARNFGDAFARILGGAALLPQFRALGDADDDALPFAADMTGLRPAIAPVRRQLLLAALVRRWDAQHRGGALSFTQAANLADSLAAVMDELETQSVDPGALQKLAPDYLAEHWQDVTQFLDFIQQAWPRILEAEARMNPAARRDLALRALARQLAENPPAGPVIAAGSTGSIPATADLLRAIAGLPQGAVVLPGLDRELDEKSWNDLDPGHPQFGMKQLLEHFYVSRAEVADWGGAARPAREYLLREVLRPAPTTDAWQALGEKGKAKIAQGLEGLNVLEAADPAREAIAIALALRQSLETPGQTAALVTPDRNLARRVAAELRRWDIEIDDSAGRPLSHTAAGVFLCLLAEAAATRFAPVPLLALLKHPFALAGQAAAPFRQQARLLDRLVLRGLAPDPGLDGITRAVDLTARNRECEGLDPWWRQIAALLQPLEDSFADGDVALSRIVEKHIAVADRLSRDTAGISLLSRDSDGDAAMDFINDLIAAAADLPVIASESYPALFRGLAAKRTVRARYNRHPRLAILGPLEARLQSFDLVVLGGLNEGTWPVAASKDAWFSRPMRKTLGLEQPERAIGLAAHDFSVLAAQRMVLLTRAQKSEGAPTIASRWLQRVTQLTRGLALEKSLYCEDDYTQYAAALTEPATVAAEPAPAPKPPVALRPRGLSVTEVETWLRDPYAIYARHVLKLRPLDELEEEIGPLERGSAVHRILELFVAAHPGTLPDDADLKLIAIADHVFAECGASQAALALWRPSFISGVHWFIALERERRARLTKYHLEIDGALIFTGPAGPFQLRCRADRIDELAAGGAAIIDYKTGAPPSRKQVRELLAPQLPLEGAILAAGGFAPIGARSPEEMAYIRYSGGQKLGEIRDIPDAALLAEKAAAQLGRRIAEFDEQTTPYPSRILPWRADVAGDYDHLARVREWSLTGWAEEE